MSHVEQEPPAAGAGGDADEEIIRPAFHHAFLKTTRLAEMKSWYALVIGLTPTFAWETGAFLSNDKANHRIVLYTSKNIYEDEGKVNHAGLHHLAFEYETGDELLATYTRLKARGIEPHMAIDHGLTTSFYYLDPDGNSLELQYDNFGDWAKSTEFMRTAPEFKEDWIGPPIDPAQLVAARARGASIEDIHRRAYAGEMKPAEPHDSRLPA
ncbi:MAG: VOC family protein [Actinomycetota bacterium]|nr:VOC family protein [Actinomycetota bacterium]